MPFNICFKVINSYSNHIINIFLFHIISFFFSRLLVLWLPVHLRVVYNYLTIIIDFLKIFFIIFLQGKTTWVYNLLKEKCKLIQPAPERVLLFFDTYQVIIKNFSFLCYYYFLKKLIF